MNKLFYILLLLSIFIMFNSCDDGFDPFGDEKKVYILNCVLKGNDSFQSAYLGESYFVDNFDPSSDSSNHTLDNSYIRIWFEDSVKVFNDTIAKQTKNYNITNYYHDDFSLLEDTEYQIEAAFKDGRKMYGKTKTPSKIKFKPTSDKLLPPEGRNYVSVSWEPSIEQLYTAARFAFVYFKDDSVGGRTRHFKAVPEDIIEHNGETVRFFPEPSYANTLRVQMSAFDKAMAEISEGDSNKENYIILGFIVEILIYDRNLTSYYASKAELSEGFSVSVNEADYSNIDGGRGIFGSFIRQYFSLKFTHEYVQAFGYTPGLTE